MIPVIQYPTCTRSHLHWLDFLDKFDRSDVYQMERSQQPENKTHQMLSGTNRSICFFRTLWLAEVAFETNWKAHLNHCELQKHLARYYLICWLNLLRRKALTNNLLNQGFEMHLLFCNPLDAGQQKHLFRAFGASSFRLSGSSTAPAQQFRPAIR